MKTLKSNIPTDSSNVPVVINTMGWMTGLGLELINYALQVFKPSHVLAFMSPVENNEDTILKCLMTNSFGLDGALNREAAEKVFVKYMGNPTADFARAKYNPADQRNLSFWSYFFGSFSNGSSIINDFKFLKNISGIRPVIVPLSNVQLACTSREIHLVNLLRSGSTSALPKLLESWMLLRVVGLARDEKFSPDPTKRVNLLSKSSRIAEMKCSGVGLIRSVVSVNSNRIHLHLITPLPLSHLAPVNTLIFGSQQVPLPILSGDSMSVRAEAPGYSTQMVGTDVNGASSRKTRHNMRRK